MTKALKEQINLIDIYRRFHVKAAEYTLFSTANETFFRVYCILEHKLSLGKFKKIEIISSIFSDGNTMSPEITCREKL